MALRFKKDDKISGKIDKDINRYIASYLEAALDYNLNDTQKLRYLYNLFDEEEKRFNKLKR